MITVNKFLWQYLQKLTDTHFHPRVLLHGDCGGKHWGALPPPPAFPLRGPVTVALVSVARGQQKCPWKGNPRLNRGPTAFVKDEKTKPNTLKLLWNIFQGTEHFESPTWEHAQHNDAFHGADAGQAFQRPPHAGLRIWPRQGMGTGSGGLASRPGWLHKRVDDFRLKQRPGLFSAPLLWRRDENESPVVT